MKYTIQTMNNALSNGYAFIDEHGCCIIIVYGDKAKDLIIEYLK